MIGRAVVPYSILVQQIDLFDYQKYAIRLIYWVCNDIWLLPRNLIGSISHLWYANLEYTKNNQYSYALFSIYLFSIFGKIHTHITAYFISIMNFVIWFHNRTEYFKAVYWRSQLAIWAICIHVQTPLFVNMCKPIFENKTSRYLFCPLSAHKQRDFNVEIFK